MSRLSEDGTIVYVLKPADHQAGVSGDSIDMGGVHSVAFIMACAGLTGNAVLTIASGATAGAATTSADGSDVSEQNHDHRDRFRVTNKRSTVADSCD